MKGRAVSVCLLALFLAGFIVSAFSVQMPRLVADVETQLDTVRQNCLRESEALSHLDFLDVDSSRDTESPSHQLQSSKRGELIVGIEDEVRLPELEEAILDSGGKIVERIKRGEEAVALVIEAPTEHVRSVTDQLQFSECVAYVEFNARIELALAPNDPHWPSQWGPAKIQADYAWNISTGASDILVAVIDTGIDYTHDDLSANYVPLGYDWVNNDTDPFDDHGHGTHCAGIIGAEINNSLGIAGLAQVSIMAEKVINSSGIGDYSWAIQAIYNAVAAGAEILSMSFTGSEDSQAMHDAIRYAYENDVLMVAASGNAGMELKQYPAAYEEVIAVSATDQDDDLAMFSNYGPWIDLAAPGVHIYSTALNDSYAYKGGTSMACPHVTGVAALALSEHENLTATEVGRLLKRNADDLGAWGIDPYYGHGRVNAWKALNESLPEHDLAVVGWYHDPRLDPGQPGIFNTTVFNYGRHNETEVTVQLLMNETVVASVNISLLEVDTSTSVSFSWNTNITGVYNATYYVVPVGGENFTENNVVSSSLLVRFPVTWRVPDDFPTIAAAVDGVAWDDTIIVSVGRYVEGQITIVKRGITLTTDGHVILDGQPGSPVLSVQADNVEISGFDIHNGTGFGIELQGDHSTLTNNTVNGEQGIRLDRSHDVRVYQCTLRGNGNGIGINLVGVSNSTVRDSEISNFNDGIKLYGSLHNAIINNTIQDNGSGVYSFSNEPFCYNLIEGNLFINNFEAIFLFGACNNTIQGNTIAHGYTGIETSYSSYNTIADNLIVNIEGRAVHLDDGSNFNSLLRNNITDGGTGVYLDHASANNVLRNNSIAGNWYNFGVHLFSVDVIIQDIDPSNTVDGKPIYYLVNRRDESVPLDAGYVALVNCTNMVVEGLELRNNLEGLLLAGTQNSTIRNNTVVSSWYDVKLVHSSNNLLLHNNFIAYADYPFVLGGSGNMWDDGYPSGGNYWSDYDGLDLYNGPYQNETGSDGIGDSPFQFLNSDNKDNYPLMKPYSGSHDIGVTEITLSKTIVGQGYSLNTTFKIVNYGLSFETTNFTAYLNATLPQICTITLSGRNSTVFAFIWNTTDLASGNYTLSCIAEPVIGELDTTDNTAFANEDVCVTIPGDQDADFDVDIFDIVILVNAYSTEEGDPKFSANCDIDGDGDVDIFDIVIATGNYGKIW